MAKKKGGFFKKALSFISPVSLLKSKNDKQKKKYEESRLAAMESYQRELAGLGTGLETKEADLATNLEARQNELGTALEAGYAPTEAERANVLRRYSISGGIGGPRTLYEQADPEFAGLYRTQALKELQNPSLRYDESVNDILKRINEEAAGGAIGRGVYGSGLHAQDYSQRALQTLVPFRMQAITNALNRGENFAKALELMRAQAVDEYNPVRQREVTGKELGAQYKSTGAQLGAGYRSHGITAGTGYKAQGSGARYGTEADIAEGNVNKYLAREAAVAELLGKAAGAAIGGAVGGPAGAAQGVQIGSGLGKSSPTQTRASGSDSMRTYSQDLYSSPDYSSYGAPFSSQDIELARNRVARQRYPYNR